MLFSFIEAVKLLKCYNRQHHPDKLNHYRPSLIESTSQTSGLPLELIVLADNIKSSKFHYAIDINTELLSDIDLLLLEINRIVKDLDGEIICNIECITVNDDNINYFNNIPTSSIVLKYEKMTDSKARQIMGLLASATNQHFHEKEPTLECSIPFYHHRFTGIIPPSSPAPTICIRKHSSQIITFDQMVELGIMPQECRETIRTWIRGRFNILIAGGTGSGKTTMGNAVLVDIKKETSQDRLAILEDTPELQCKVPNHYKQCKTNERDMPSLLRTALRMNPKRIVVGEVRGAEAYTLLKAWGSGHPGGFATIHAGNAEEALTRFEQCISESREAGIIQRKDIARAVGGIISIQKVTLRVEKDGQVEYIVKRKVTALRQINDYDEKHNIYEGVYLYRDDSPFEQNVDKVDSDYLGIEQQ